jgi:hypothetical protein
VLTGGAIAVTATTLTKVAVVAWGASKRVVTTGIPTCTSQSI